MSRPTTMTVVVERWRDGGLRFTLPDLPAFAVRAERSGAAIAGALEECWRETDIAAYAATQGAVHDLEAHDYRALEGSHGSKTVGGHSASRVDFDPDAVNLTRAERVRLALSRQREDITSNPSVRVEVKQRAKMRAKEQDRIRQALLWRFVGDAWESPAGRRYRLGSKPVVDTVATLRRHGRLPAGYDDPRCGDECPDLRATCTRELGHPGVHVDGGYDAERGRFLGTSWAAHDRGQPITG